MHKQKNNYLFIKSLSNFNYKKIIINDLTIYLPSTLDNIHTEFQNVLDQLVEMISSSETSI